MPSNNISTSSPPPAASSSSGGNPQPQQHQATRPASLSTTTAPPPLLSSSSSSPSSARLLSSVPLPPTATPLGLLRRLNGDYRIVYALIKGLPHAFNSDVTAALLQLAQACVGGSRGGANGMMVFSNPAAVVAGSSSSGGITNAHPRHLSLYPNDLYYGDDGVLPSTVLAHFIQLVLTIELDEHLTKEKQKNEKAIAQHLSNKTRRRSNNVSGGVDGHHADTSSLSLHPINVFGFLRGNTVASLLLDALLNTMPPAAVSVPIVATLGVRESRNNNTNAINNNNTAIAAASTTIATPTRGSKATSHRGSITGAVAPNAPPTSIGPSATAVAAEEVLGDDSPVFIRSRDGANNNDVTDDGEAPSPTGGGKDASPAGEAAASPTDSGAHLRAQSVDGALEEVILPSISSNGGGGGGGGEMAAASASVLSPTPANAVPTPPPPPTSAASLDGILALALVARNDAEEVPIALIQKGGEQLIARLTALLTALGGAVGAWPAWLLRALAGMCRRVDGAVGEYNTAVKNMNERRHGAGGGGSSGPSPSSTEQHQQQQLEDSHIFLNTVVLLRYISPRILKLCEDKQQQREVAGIFARALQKVANGQPCFPHVSVCSNPSTAEVLEQLEDHMAAMNAEVKALNKRILSEIGPQVRAFYTILLSAADNLTNNNNANNSNNPNSTSPVGSAPRSPTSQSFIPPPSSPFGAGGGGGGAALPSPTAQQQNTMTVAVSSSPSPPPSLFTSDRLIRTLLLKHLARITDCMHHISPLTSADHGSKLLELVAYHYMRSHEAGMAVLKGGDLLSSSSSSLPAAFRERGQATTTAPSNMSITGNLLAVPQTQNVALGGVGGAVVGLGGSRGGSANVTRSNSFARSTSNTELAAMGSSTVLSPPPAPMTFQDKLWESLVRHGNACMLRPVMSAHPHQFITIVGPSTALPYTMMLQQSSNNNAAAASSSSSSATAASDGCCGLMMKGFTGGGGGATASHAHHHHHHDYDDASSVLPPHLSAAPPSSIVVFINGDLLRMSEALVTKDPARSRVVLGRSLPLFRTSLLQSGGGGNSNATAADAGESPLTASFASPLLTANDLEDVPLDGDLVAHLAAFLDLLVVSQQQTNPTTTITLVYFSAACDLPNNGSGGGSGAAAPAAGGGGSLSLDASAAHEEPPSLFNHQWFRNLFTSSASPQQQQGGGAATTAVSGESPSSSSIPPRNIIPPRVLQKIDRIVFCRAPPPATQGGTSLKDKVRTAGSRLLGGLVGGLGGGGGGGGASTTASLYEDHIVVPATNSNNSNTHHPHTIGVQFIEDPLVLIESLSLFPFTLRACPLSCDVALSIQNQGSTAATASSSTNAHNNNTTTNSSTHDKGGGGGGGNGKLASAERRLFETKVPSLFVLHASSSPPLSSSAASSYPLPFSTVAASSARQLLCHFFDIATRVNCLSLTQNLNTVFREAGILWFSEISKFGGGGLEASQQLTFFVSHLSGAPWEFASSNSSSGSNGKSSAAAAAAAAQFKQEQRAHFTSVLTASFCSRQKLGVTSVTPPSTTTTNQNVKPSPTLPNSGGGGGGLLPFSHLWPCASLKTVPMRPLWRIVLSLIWGVMMSSSSPNCSVQKALLCSKLHEVFLGIAEGGGGGGDDEGAEDGSAAAFSPLNAASPSPSSPFPSRGRCPAAMTAAMCGSAIAVAEQLLVDEDAFWLNLRRWYSLREEEWPGDSCVGSNGAEEEEDEHAFDADGASIDARLMMAAPAMMMMVATRCLLSATCGLITELARLNEAAMAAPTPLSAAMAASSSSNNGTVVGGSGGAASPLLAPSSSSPPTHTNNTLPPPSSPSSTCAKAIALTATASAIESILGGVGVGKENNSEGADTDDRPFSSSTSASSALIASGMLLPLQHAKYAAITTQLLFVSGAPPTLLDLLVR